MGIPRGTVSVRVVLILRETGSKSPCIWLSSVGIYNIEVLGAKVIYCFTYKKANIAFMQIGTCVLELIETKDEVQSDSGPVNLIAFAVKNIESVVEELKEKGVEFEGNEVMCCSDYFENGAK